MRKIDRLISILQWAKDGKGWQESAKWATPTGEDILTNGWAKVGHDSIKSYLTDTGEAKLAQLKAIECENCHKPYKAGTGQFTVFGGWFCNECLD
jgi:hypothetical protein